MFRNLKAEMGRNSIRAKDIAKALNVREATISFKMNGKSDFTFNEAKQIKEIFFPDLDIEYLFA
ncbi:helix-turn-helix domain-containing protein [Zhenhengia yiwuensis]|uniref:XRE family transcriptional regulator n=1 Tax=Zhenhengia yiwuensis TaxID=2763666 RepID=A0A926IB26_9FIRM|nr:XRE family transcriptional regulator [Zhenhengia yiwuensis]MBC8581495.1 XRE family transcriptional regulator [Zhenhengia yiwuensis]